MIKGGIVWGVKYLFTYIKKFKKNFILFYIGWFIESILTVITPVIFSIMVDEIVYYKNINTFLRISFLYIFVAFFLSILYFLIYNQHQHLMSMYVFSIRKELFKKILNLKPRFLKELKRGDQINTLLVDSTECMVFIIRNIIHLINGLIKILFYLTYVYIISIEAGVVVTLILPVASIISFKSSKKVRKISEKERDDRGNYLSWLFETLKGISEIRLLSAEGTIFKRFKMYKKILFKRDIKTSINLLFANRGIEALNLLMMLTIYIISALLVFKQNLTIGNVLVIITFTLTLKELLLNTANSLLDSQKRITSIKRVYKLMSYGDEKSWPGKTGLTLSRGSVEFSNLRFSYSEKLFDGLNLRFPSGKVTALVGSSGSGKSTLLSLLLGMEDNYQGEILIDGQNIREKNLKSIRGSIGVVFQDFIIVDGSLRENLLFGIGKKEDAEIYRALELVGLKEYLLNLDKKLDTQIGPGQSGLSGGQKQRLALARIYLKNPKILVFDEVMSAQNSEIEEQLFDSWKRVFSDKTIIVVTHSYNTASKCDHLVHIEKGRVLNSGSTRELFSSDEKLKELFCV